MERTFTARTELEASLVEQALAMARELEAASDATPDGQVLAVAEEAAVRAGRELTLAALEAALHRQAEASEKKGPPAALPLRRVAEGQGQGPQDARDLGRSADDRALLDAVQPLRPDGHRAADRLGLDGFLSPGATRLACLAAATWSFDVAAETPAGWATLDGMIGYFAKHVGRLGDADRLREGRSIGSGSVEGLTRTMGQRLKAPAAVGSPATSPAWPPSSARRAGTVTGRGPPYELRDRELHPPLKSDNFEIRIPAEQSWACA